MELESHGGGETCGPWYTCEIILRRYYVFLMSFHNLNTSDITWLSYLSGFTEGGIILVASAVHLNNMEQHLLLPAVWRPFSIHSTLITCTLGVRVIEFTALVYYMMLAAKCYSLWKFVWGFTLNIWTFTYTIKPNYWIIIHTVITNLLMISDQRLENLYALYQGSATWGSQCCHGMLEATG